MKYAILLILISTPAMAQDWEQADRDNAATWQHEEQTRKSLEYSDEDMQHTPSWQAPEPVYGDNRAPVEILQDCASTGSCSGAFDPYK